MEDPNGPTQAICEHQFTHLVDDNKDIIMVVGEDTEKLEPSHAAGEDRKRCSCC